MDTVQFGALTNIELQETPGADGATWVLVDESGRKASFRVGTKALAFVLQLTCGLVDRGASGPQRVPPAQGGMSIGLPASGIEVSPGRTPKEVSLHVHLGKVDVAYMVPLDSVIVALGTLVSGLSTDPGLPTH